MDKVKKHLAVPFLLLFILIFGSVYYTLSTIEDNSTFYVRDLSGDPSAIADVTITGDLSDGYHSTVFKLSNGQVSTETKIYDQPTRVWDKRYPSDLYKLMDGYLYEVQGSLSFDIVARDVNNQYAPATASVIPGLIYHNSQPNTYTYANPLVYGLTKIGDQVYFTVPTSADYTGSNGIYELAFSYGDRSSIPLENWPKTQELAAIDLDQNKSDPANAIHVLGLEAVGDKLALIMTEGTSLIVRGYDSESGKLIGEAVVPQFINLEAEMSFESHSARYVAYSDHEHHILNLSFDRYPNVLTNQDVYKTILSVDFSNGVELVDYNRAHFTDGKVDNNRGISHISHRNGKTYVVMTLGDKEDRIPHSIIWPQRFMLYVLKSDELLYQGELITDVNDDLIRDSQSAGNFSYDMAEYRNFFNIKIE
ncbi:hypothetical protein [Paenibacillus marinisediminis]